MVTKFYGFTTTEANEKPLAALAYTNIDALLGAIVQLDGRGSYDPEKKSLSYTWKFKQLPSGSLLDNSSFRSVRPGASAVSFIPDKLGIYVVELTVSDGELDSEPVDCIVNIQLSQVPIGEGKVPDAKFLWSYISDFWNLVEDKAYITAIWSSVIQLIGAETIKLWSNDYNKSLKTIQNSVQRRWQEFKTEVDILAETQRIIVGNASSGTEGFTGTPGVAPGAGTTPSFFVPKAVADFTGLEQNYGALGRLIVINGKGHTISRVLNSTVDGTDYSIIICDEASLIDGLVGVKWRVPSLLHVPGHDLEVDGVSPGDVIEFEVKRRDVGHTAELRAQVIGVDGERVGFEFSLEDLDSVTENIQRDLIIQLVRDLRIAAQSDSDFKAATRAEALIGFMPPGINLTSRPFSRYSITMQARKIIRNSSVKILEEAISIPALQESLYEPEVIMRENLDYLVESGYLNFATGLFTLTDPSPAILWAETVFYDNGGVIEANFGKLVGLSRDDLTQKQTRAPYLAAVKGLFYAMTYGPKISNIRLGLQILLGLPFAEERGKILEIENNYGTDSEGNPLGRMLVEDVDQFGKRIGIRRSYFYPTVVGLETNTQTGQLYRVGDFIQQWSPVCKGVDVQDYIRVPLWWKYALRGLEILKFFTFRVTVDTQVFNTNDVNFAFDFVKKIKPAYTRVLMAALQKISDDIEVEESSLMTGKIVIYDDLNGLESTEKLDNASSQGFVLQAVGSHPFSTRTKFLVRDVTTFLDPETGLTAATSLSGGWDFTQIRARIGYADVFPYSPIREGDILAIAPGQQGSGALTWGLYEITEVRINKLILGYIAPPGDVADLTTYEAIIPTAFEYGENLVCSIIRREKNPIIMGNDLTLSSTGNIAESLSAQFMTNGIGVDDHLIVESGPNLGEYRIEKVPAASIVTPNITETQVTLLNLDGTTPTFSDQTSGQFRVIRHYLVSKRVVDCVAAAYNPGVMAIGAVNADFTNFYDAFTPGMVGTVINVSDADNPVNDGDFIIIAYLAPSVVLVNNPICDVGYTPMAVAQIRSIWHEGFEFQGEMRPYEAVSLRLVSA
jgi:hypothetical protein